MTNPWGLDWDERGEMFMSGNVNGHLWHGIPEALYDRMFGAGSVPHDYERLKMIGERPHYPSSGDWRQDWLLPEKGRDANNELGGGHSHCGLLIYQGDNWPDAYRGQFFLCNTHGRRVNWETVKPKGSSFSARHRGDVLVSGNQWFRGVSLVCGPDGGVFVSDWCDNGECHDDDGVHRSSGRIYKIVFGQPRKVSQDLASRSDDELAGLMVEKNDWFARHARRLLQERTVGAAGKLAESAVKKLRALLAGGESVPHRLRSLWTLHACMLLTADELMAASQSPDESLRAWAVRLMCEDRDLLESEKAALLSMAQHDPSPRVRLYLASVIERVPPGMRWALAEALMKRSEDAADNTVQLEVWHAIEPLVAADDGHAAGVVEACVFPKLRGFITRRIAAEIDDPEARDALGHLLANAAAKGGALAEDVATGAQTGLAGRTKLTAPPGWAETAALLLASGSARVRDAALDLSVAFGDAATLDRLRLLVRDASAPALQRVEGLRGLIRARAPDLPKQLVEAFKDPALRLTALRGFGATGDPAAATLILDAYGTFSAEEKQAAVETLSSRPGFARVLLEATASGKVPRTDISPSQARLILALKDAKLKDLLAKSWGNVQPSGAAKEAQIAHVKSMLASNSEVPPDPIRGRAVFTRVCATCHVLFGEGGRLGPDLTGSGRKDLDYLVRNIVDPSAILPRDYRLTIVTLLNGQVLTGVVPREDDKTLSLQSVVELRVLDRADIAKIETQPYSWMPEGLLDALSEHEVRDLVAYLQSDSPLSKSTAPPSQ
jgi:putative heme-binding domain-containing protein